MEKIEIFGSEVSFHYLTTHSARIPPNLKILFTTENIHFPGVQVYAPKIHINIYIYIYPYILIDFMKQKNSYPNEV